MSFSPQSPMITNCYGTYIFLTFNKLNKKPIQGDSRNLNALFSPSYTQVQLKGRIASWWARPAPALEQNNPITFGLTNSKEVNSGFLQLVFPNTNSHLVRFFIRYALPRRDSFCCACANRTKMRAHASHIRKYVVADDMLCAHKHSQHTKNGNIHTRAARLFASRPLFGENSPNREELFVLFGLFHVQFGYCCISFVLARFETRIVTNNMHDYYHNYYDDNYDDFR